MMSPKSIARWQELKAKKLRGRTVPENAVTAWFTPHRQYLGQILVHAPYLAVELPFSHELPFTA